MMAGSINNDFPKKWHEMSFGKLMFMLAMCLVITVYISGRATGPGYPQ